MTRVLNGCCWFLSFLSTNKNKNEFYMKFILEILTRFPIQNFKTCIYNADRTIGWGEESCKKEPQAIALNMTTGKKKLPWKPGYVVFTNKIMIKISVFCVSCQIKYDRFQHKRKSKKVKRNEIK